MARICRRQARGEEPRLAQLGSVRYREDFGTMPAPTPIFILAFRQEANSPLNSPTTSRTEPAPLIRDGSHDFVEDSNVVAHRIVIGRLIRTNHARRMASAFRCGNRTQSLFGTVTTFRNSEEFRRRREQTRTTARPGLWFRSEHGLESGDSEMRQTISAVGCLVLLTIAGCGMAAKEAAETSKPSSAPISQPQIDHVAQLKYHSEAPHSSSMIMRGEAVDGLHAANEVYVKLPENSLLATKDQPLSTFSIDVDTASYSNVRRFLRDRQLPPVEAVRIEELINYFPYDDPAPAGNTPFSVNVEIAGCPWNGTHRLARIGLKGKTVTRQSRPQINVVFLIDVSGSMNHPKKLPLVKDSLKLLVDQLGEADHIGIVVYAGAAGAVLPATSATNRERIHAAIDGLSAGGSTNGSLGIRLAYDIARENLVPGAVNRVVLCTDGDFNVGVTGPRELQELIEGQAKSGIFLTVLGFGFGNLKDVTMEQLADHGNGNYGYIDTLAEAKKLLVDQMSGTLVTIAKDVKIQVEFNPAQVAAYRLIGYENRRLATRDFNDDKKDAGEIGAGHSVTALYELIPVGAPVGANKGAEPLRYASNQKVAIEQIQAEPVRQGALSESLVVKLRYKEPTGDTSRLIEFPTVDTGLAFGAASNNLRFAAAVAEFGMLLSESSYRGNTTYDEIAETAAAVINSDAKGYRAEFLELVRLARDLTNDRRLMSKVD